MNDDDNGSLIDFDVAKKALRAADGTTAMVAGVAERAPPPPLAHSDLMTVGDALFGEGWLDGAARSAVAAFLSGGEAEAAFDGFLARGRFAGRRAMSAEIASMVRTNGIRWGDDLKDAATAALVEAIETRARVSLTECDPVWPVADE